MPNHVTNKLVFTGEESRIREIEALLVIDDPESPGEKAITFQNITPRPEILERTISGRFVDMALIALGRPDLSRYSSSENYPYNIPWIASEGITTPEQLRSFFERKHPDSMQAALVSIEAFEQTGYVNWYDWSWDNWGTKWDAYDGKVVDREPGRLVVMFDTAWSPPMPVLRKLARDFPDVGLAGWHLDEIPNFAIKTRSDVRSGYLIDIDVDMKNKDVFRKFKSDLFEIPDSPDQDTDESATPAF